MVLCTQKAAGWLCSAARRFAARFSRNTSGFTAIEFAAVSMPFVLLIFGIISVCLFFFTTFALENAVWQASRTVRTGQFQNGAGAYASMTADQKKAAFKAAVCNLAPSFVDCAGRVRVMMQARSDFNGIAEPDCLNAGNLIDEAAAGANFDAGSASSVVLVTACYAWQFGGHLPFMHMGKMADGSLLIQASAAFRSEPYN
ncbi:MAG: TadE/TadG family type IV pilus assembly protein [Hyphomicrobiaceae bacterium]|jgi:Flp pilus assembly protein TadG